ncbi:MULTISPECIES: relaxase/mobilization nuclease domain-containing protein [Ramlibacter]|uniref:Relaxase/mobilization nuclease domain-containing protein n=1 Tax=Ramlibacter aquaticus TaxID=2780094 RepID=A0ABR9SH67_9BURK|nr:MULTISPECIES: relaxase/mobilization nuclease domain-containing protein [Ramlibacter]MBE7941696.1 relaxase/mobilization nuclease domain-containing protein [Ramlibacter aquaticus]
MLIKFFPYGTGSGTKAVAYLIGRYDYTGVERAEVRVLRGNPAMLGHLVNGLPFVHRYTSAVIAWHREDEPTDADIDAVLEDFERVAFAGLDKGDYAYLAVLHVDEDGSKHIHLFVPRVELSTGRSLNIAPPGWEKAFAPFRDAWNFERGWARPDDPDRARAIYPGPRWRQQSLAQRLRRQAESLREGGLGESLIAEVLELEQDVHEALRQLALKLVMDGDVESREELVAKLSQMGEISRQGADYISIRPSATGKAIRLRGPIFERQADYRALRALEDERRRVAEDEERRVLKQFAAVDHERAAEARRQLGLMLQRRAGYNRCRFKRGVEMRLHDDVAVGARSSAVFTGAPGPRAARGDSLSKVPRAFPGPATATIGRPRPEDLLEKTDERTHDSVARSIDGLAGREAAAGRTAPGDGSVSAAAPGALEPAGRAIDVCLDAVGRAYRAVVSAARRLVKRAADKSAQLEREVDWIAFAQSRGYSLVAQEDDGMTRTTVLERGAGRIVFTITYASGQVTLTAAGLR